MKVELPDLHMRTLLGGQPLPGGWVHLTLETSEKNPFTMTVGPSDETGKLDLTAGELERRVVVQRSTSLMDYAGLDQWDSSIIIRVLNRDGIARALAAFDRFGDVPGGFSAEDARSLGAYDEALRQARGETLEVAVTGSVGDVVIGTVSSRA